MGPAHEVSTNQLVKTVEIRKETHMSKSTCAVRETVRENEINCGHATNVFYSADYLYCLGLFIPLVFMHKSEFRTLNLDNETLILLFMFVCIPSGDNLKSLYKI